MSMSFALSPDECSLFRHKTDRFQANADRLGTQLCIVTVCCILGELPVDVVAEERCRHGLVEDQSHHGSVDHLGRCYLLLLVHDIYEPAQV